MNNPNWRNILVFTPAALLLLLFSGGLLHEYWLVGVVADPGQIAAYHFGAGENNGADSFQTASDYVSACLAAALVAFAGFVVSSIVLVKTRYQPLFKAWGCTLVTMFLMRLVTLMFT